MRREKKAWQQIEGSQKWTTLISGPSFRLGQILSLDRKCNLSELKGTETHGIQELTPKLLQPVSHLTNRGNLFPAPEPLGFLWVGHLCQAELIPPTSIKLRQRHQSPDQKIALWSGISMHVCKRMRCKSLVWSNKLSYSRIRIQRALSTIDIPVPLEKMLDRYTQLLRDNEVVITHFLVSESQSLGEQFPGGAFNFSPIFTSKKQKTNKKTQHFW